MRFLPADDSKRAALESVVRYDPAPTVLIVAMSTVAALLERVGLGFLLPVLASGSDVDVSGCGGSRVLEGFETPTPSSGSS